MIQIIGSGVVGLTLADYFLQAGYNVSIITANSGVDESNCSWWAGGMLAPFCEMESAEPLVGELSTLSMSYWKSLCADFDCCTYSDNGTLVICPNRDQNMLKHFSQKTTNWQTVGAKIIHELEPLLCQYHEGLFYPTEAHIEPRKVLHALWKKVSSQSEVAINTVLTDDDIEDLATNNNWVFDCRGFHARSVQKSLRGVRGEMLHLYNPEVTLSRPIRLLHPRIPIYLVPRSEGQFMLGATMIENSSSERASVRSVLELLSALYAVNPVFSQSEIVEIGVDVRPAYADNLPKVTCCGNLISINGMYRHGYLLAPAVSKIVRDFVTNQKDNQLIHHEN